MLSEDERWKLWNAQGTDEMNQKEADAFIQAIEAAVLTKLQAQSEPDQRLVNLLCRIHRDGGHYIADHGIDKAVDDADVLIAELNALRDSAPVQQDVNQQLLEALKRLIGGKMTMQEVLEAIQQARAAIAAVEEKSNV